MNTRLPSWFWLLLCVASFAGAVLAWSLDRPRTARQFSPPVAVAANPEPEESPSSPSALPAVPAQPTQANAAITGVRTAFSVAPPVDTGAAPRVLRCDVRGRVTYIDVASACPDGSQGKVTVLPR